MTHVIRSFRRWLPSSVSTYRRSPQLICPPRYKHSICKHCACIYMKQVTIQFRLPDNSKPSRRFNASDRIQACHMSQ